MFKRPNGELADIYSLKQTYLNYSKQMLPFNIFVFVKGDNENLSAVLLVAHFRAEPFLQGLDRPTDLVDAGPGLDENKIASFDQQVTVEASKSDDV